jgi:hypothetical protein
MIKRGWILDAITDDSGAIDVGNLGLFILIGLVLGVIPFMCAGALTKAVLSIWKVDFNFDPQTLGVAVGAVCGGFATAIGGWGAARRLADNKGAVTNATSTTTIAADGATQQTKEVTSAGAENK